MNKLIFVPMPLAEESPHSLVKRAARCHGFATAGQLNGLCIGPQTFRSMSLTQNSDFAKLFVAEAGIYGPTVQEGFYATIERAKQRRRFVIGKIEIPITYLRLRTGAYCDGCFDQGWERQVRDLKFAEFCPYHLKQYLFQCHECHMRVEWWHALDGKCQYCNTILKCKPCTLVECRLERMLVDLMRTQSQFDFDRLLALTRQLGYAPEKPTMPDATRRMIVMGAFAIMTDDSRAILEHLFTLHSLHPNVEKFWIAARFSLIDTAATREASRIFLETKCEPMRKLAHSTTPFLLSLRQLRVVLNVSASQMAKIKKLTSFAQRPIYSCFTVDEAVTLASKVMDYLSADGGRLPIAKEKMLTRAKTCLKLGISPSSLRVYEKCKLLTPCLGCKHAPFFFADDIEKFSDIYEPFQNLSRKTGITNRRLYAILDLLNIDISPNRELKGRLWLIKKTDIERIIAATTKGAKKIRLRLILPRADFSETPETEYSTLRETAKEIQTAVSNVFAAIQQNLLKGARRGRKMRLLIPKSEIQEFKSQFTTIMQAAKILKVNFPQTSDLLFGFGIRAVLGPLVNGARDNIYRTADILQVAKLAETEDPGEHFNYYSKTFVANHLHVPPDVLLMIVDADLINCVKGNVGIYFRPSCLHSFEERFIVPNEISKIAHLPYTMIHYIVDALKQIEITPITLKSRGRCSYLYNRSDIADSYDNFLEKMTHLDKSRNYRTYIKRTTKPPPKGYTPVEDLLDTYDITATDFSNLFIKYGFATTMINNGAKYISESNKTKCEYILKNYYTCTMAGKITPGGYGKITTLLRSGILEKESPIPANLTQTRLISRSALHKYLSTLPSL